MANQITPANVPPPVGSTSRYASSEVIYWGSQNKITYTTYRRKSYPEANTDRYIVNMHEYRPDLVAYEEYGVQNFWWRILEANGMKDIWEFKAGVNIRLPASIF